MKNEFLKNDLRFSSLTHKMSRINLNRFSKIITQDKSQGASQAMLYALKLKESDLEKAQVGIGSNWFESNPCNNHLNTLSSLVKDSISKRNSLIGFRFNTIGVSDGITNGTTGMTYSLISREIIADSIETIVNAQFYDGIVAVVGCDKNMPGAMMAIGRLNRPSILVYGGTIKSGSYKGSCNRSISEKFLIDNASFIEY